MPKDHEIWAASWQNQQNGMCAQRRLRSAWASAQSDQFSLCAQWVAKDPSFLHADSEDSHQTGRMPRLIWVFAGRRVILLVLSWGGWCEFPILHQVLQKRSSCTPKEIIMHSKWCVILNRHVVFEGNIQIISFQGFEFRCIGPALTCIKEGTCRYISWKSTQSTSALLKKPVPANNEKKNNLQGANHNSEWTNTANGWQSTLMHWHLVNVYIKNIKYGRQKMKRIQYSLQNYNQLRIVDKIFIIERNLL